VSNVYAIKTNKFNFFKSSEQNGSSNVVKDSSHEWLRKKWAMRKKVKNLLSNIEQHSFPSLSLSLFPISPLSLVIVSLNFSLFTTFCITLRIIANNLFATC
jgi:hypothetical protein